MENGNIAAGFLTDLGNLIERFQLKRSIRYSDFVTAWHELEFYKICYGRSNPVEQAEFIDTIFQITTKFLCMRDVSKSLSNSKVENWSLK